MKRAYNIDEQISLLKEYGVIFDNEEKAKEILLDVGFIEWDSILSHTKRLSPH